MTSKTDLERELETMRTFVGTASEQLRDPVRALSRVSYALSTITPPLAADVAIRLRDMQARAQELDERLTRILEYAQWTTQGEAPESIDLTSLMTEIDHLVRRPAGCSISTAGPRTLVAVRRAITRLFHVLVDNAIRHHDHADGQISISLAGLDAGWWQVTVRDDGPGIPEDHLERVFEPFHTVRRQDRRCGTGLGLALARKIVGEAGGRISASSTALRRGTTVTFTWPRF